MNNICNCNMQNNELAQAIDQIWMFLTALSSPPNGGPVVTVFDALPPIINLSY
ncbi:MAG: hypothetical protein JXR36_04505 [Bacteroidales bacterium]|nr:hypothetical protein [Bacteroidales bacterium]